MPKAKHTVFEEVPHCFGPFSVIVAEVGIKDNAGNTESVNRVCFERGDCVAVLVRDAMDDSILLTKQWRYPVERRGGDGYILEIPAGKIDAGEAPEDAATREIVEELGVTISHLRLLNTFFVSPGGTSERIHLFYAEVNKKVSDGGGVAEEHEHIEIVRISRPLFLTKVNLGTIHDAKTLIAGLWLIRQEI
jgi:nudix-type nucleoside diphosphatase (YffH/AdpP family)